MKKYSVLVIITVLSAMIFGCGSEKKTEVKSYLIPVQVSEGGKWGYIDLDGNFVIDTLFADTPSYFREGFAIIKISDGVFDFIDEAGKKMGKKYAEASLFSEGLACVAEKDGPPYFINTKFEKVFELKEAYMAGMVGNGMVRFKDKSGKWGFADGNGKIIVKPQYDNVISYSDQLAVVVAKESDSVSKFGIINTKGDYVLKLTDSVKYLRPFREGMAAYSNGKGWGYLGPDGKPVIPANSNWEEATPFYHGIASVKEGGEWGAINTKGEFVIQPLYAMPLKFFNGTAVIMDNNKFGFMDESEQILIKPVYKEVAFPFYSDKAIVRAGNHYIILNKDGKTLAGKSYKSVNPMFITVEEELYTVMSNTPEVVAMHKAMTDSLNALKQAQTATADSLAKLQSSGMTMEQQFQQQQLMQQQMMQQMLNLSPRQLAQKMAESLERIMAEGRGNMDKLAQGLVIMQSQVGMILQKKQTDKKYMEEFQKEVVLIYKPVEDKYKGELEKIQQYVAKKQQEYMEKQKSPGK